MQSHTTGIVLAALTVVSAASAQSTQAVEWKVSEGGNGHWYQGVILSETYVSWSVSDQYARDHGGKLASLTSEGEANWVFQSVVSNVSLWRGTFGPWVGLYQTPNASEPAGGWVWVDGTPNGGALPWIPGQPDNYVPCGAEQYACYWTGDWAPPPPRNFICDLPGTGWCSFRSAGDWVVSAVVEWDADCNADGIVDYGQILRGELADLNSNGVPDVCEISVSGVTPPSVPSQGGSTITIRGTNFQGTPSVKIGGIPATNVVTVSPISLTATSPALAPGMTSVTVNGFTLPDAIYIRPECGSDLDQNGVVDTADISIILLDFGPCYETPAALASPTPAPLLVPDEATPAPTPPAPQSARPTPQPRGTAS